MPFTKLENIGGILGEISLIAHFVSKHFYEISINFECNISTQGLIMSIQLCVSLFTCPWWVCV